MMKTADIGWVAGLVEGEGCLGLYKSSGGLKRKHPTVTVAMTDEDVVCRLATVTGFGTVQGPYQYGERKLAWRWSVSKSGEVAQLLMTIFSLLGERRRARAKELLAGWKHMPGPGKPKQPIRHGTIGGYSAHVERQDPACTSCLEANRTYHQTWNLNHPGSMREYRRKHHALQKEMR